MNNLTLIDYSKIASANEYYSGRGYKNINVPWFVSDASINSTFQEQSNRKFSTFAGNLVASGEQSFVEIRNKLKRGKYQCTTPCFRAEKELNDATRMFFLKTELIHVFDRNKETGVSFLNDMVLDSLFFFSGFDKFGQLEIKTTEIGLDINMNGIEIGSYGIRSYEGFYWVYGTGCAEPRLSFALKQKIEEQERKNVKKGHCSINRRRKKA